MSETPLSDAEALALAGTTDSETDFQYHSVGQATYYLDGFRQRHRVLTMLKAVNALRVYKDSDLTFGVRAGDYLNGDSLIEYSGATGQSLTDDDANYVYLTAAGVLTKNTTGFPLPSVTPHIRLATIVTSGGQYDHDNITDYRGTALVTIADGSAGLGAFDWQESLADELNFTSAEPSSPSAGDRYLNTGTGSSNETSQSVTANYIYQWNGTNWTEIVPTEGACALVEDRDMLIAFNASSWVDIGSFALLNEAQAFFAATDLSGAEAETLSDGSNADSLHVHTLAAMTGTLDRADLTEDSLARYQVSLMADCRKADGTVLDATGGSGLFKIVAGGWGVGTLVLQSETALSDTKTDTLAFEFTLPPEYVADADVKVNIHAARQGAGTGTTKTIDVEAYELTDEGAVGSDLCATAAIALADTNWADRTFTITDAGLTAGDKLIVMVRTVLQEETASDMYAQIGSIEVQLDVKG